MRKILSAALALVCVWFATPSWGALPDGYTQLEYIESTGTQYIDTGVVPNQDTSVRLDAQYLNYNSGSNGILFGARTSSTANVYVVQRLTAGNWNMGYNNGSVIVGTADTNRHMFYKNKQYQYLDGELKGTGTYSAFTCPGTAILFGFNDNGTPSTTDFPAKAYSLKIYDNNTLVRDFIPAKNSSGVVGMYDTVNNRFYTNAGTGEFIAGAPVTNNSCRNLLDTTNQLMPCYISADGTEHCNEQDFEMSKAQINVVEGEQYTLSWIAGSSQLVYKRIHGYDANGNWKGQIAEQRTEAAGPYSITMTIPSGVKSVLISGKRNIDTDMQFERGSTATPYAPYCETPIKIATTKYNETAFGPLNTALQNAISVVDTVVSNTITQAGRIATLQAQKQTRPNDIADDNEKCPAGKKCLLVEDASGVPHWYEIVENAWDLPVGYTQLQYIESTGTQWIDTGYAWASQNRKVDMDVMITTYTSNSHFFASTGGSKYDLNPYFGSANSSFTTYIGSTSYNTATSAKDVKNNIVWNLTSDKKFSLQVNGTSVGTATVTEIPTSGISVWLLHVHSSGNNTWSPLRAKLYQTKMWDNDELVRDFVPAKNPDGKIGMYDLVGERFYENAGTGEFIAGDPVSE